VSRSVLVVLTLVAAVAVSHAQVQPIGQPITPTGMGAWNDAASGGATAGPGTAQRAGGAAAPRSTNWGPYTATGTPFEGSVPRADVPANYVLRTGDQVMVTVWEAPEFSLGATIIRPDGKIMHSFLGEVVAAGKTPIQLAEEIRKGLAKELKNPTVTVSVLGYKQESFFILGAVPRTGTFPVAIGINVQQVLAWAGGWAPETDRTHATLITPDGQRTEFNPEEELKLAPGKETIKVRAGSIVIFYEKERRFFAALGAVNAPGIYEIAENGRLSDAISLVRGFPSDSAPETARLTRLNQPALEVDLRKVMDDPNGPDNIALRDGDCLLVSNRPTALALGEVNEPGSKPLPKGAKVSNLIALAGGLTREADESAAHLMRTDGTLINVDLSQLLAGRSADLDVVLLPGDALMVPRLQYAQCVALGAIKLPGRYPMEPGSRVSHLLAKSGGLDGEPDRCRASIMHADGTNNDVDLQKIMVVRDPLSDTFVQDGDTLIVRSMSSGYLTVLGAVGNPGRYALAQVRYLSDLMALCGRSEQGANTGTLFRADGTTTTVDLDAVVTERRPEANLEMREGDTLYVSSIARKVVVLGAVKMPGRYVLRQGNRFSDALAMAGDLTELADRNRAKILRADGTTLDVDPTEAISGRNRNANPLLEDDDTIIIAVGQIQVAVLGEVNKPSQYLLRPGDRFSDAIAQAGGLVAGGRARQAKLVRADGTTTMVDLDLVLNKTDAEANVPLADRDTIVIEAGPKTTVAVIGQVLRPGLYDIPANARLSDAVALASGFTLDAAPEVSRLTRKGAVTLTVDLQKALEDPRSADNLMLQDGDALIVVGRANAVIMGEVVTPGSKPLQKGARLSQLLALAGGPTREGDLSHALLMHADGTYAQMNLRDIAATPALDAEVRPGDALYVPRIEYASVVVFGAVKMPGRYPLEPGSRILNAVAAAGGLDGDVRRCRASLMHADGNTVEVELRSVLEDRDPQANVLVRDGDTLIVRSMAAGQVAALGAVKNSGRFSMAQCRFLSDLVALATPSEEAGSKALLLRPDGEKVNVDLDMLLSDKRAALNLELQDGDTLFVNSVAQRVVVLGAVKQPGQFSLRMGNRFSDALAAAGDMTETADREKAQILRASGKIMAVNPTEATAGKDPQANPPLEDGDTVVINDIPDLTVHVLGRVKMQGAYHPRRGARLSQIIAAAGGLETDADATKVSLLRDGTEQRVDMTPLLTGMTMENDPSLQDGDLVSVPQSIHTATVLGAVNRPGVITFRVGDHVLDAVGAAGGWLPTLSAPQSTILTRRIPEGMAWSPVNLILGTRGDAKNNPALKDGDIIFVPDPRKNRFKEVMQTIFPLASLIQVVTP
jgi:protein involved in polysaccharide export with SLBB domain